MQIKLFLAIAAAAIASPVLVPGLVVGQSSATTEPHAVKLVDCFTRYRFGSVQAKLTTNVMGTTSGSPIPFSGSIVNDNDYPILDGALYVKVLRLRSNEKNANGPDVVDHFLVRGDIVIPPRGSVPVNFTWNVPAFAVSGEYLLATFFTTSRKFNLLGLSFTDDVVGNTVPFKVSGEIARNITIDKTSVTVDDEPYYFAAYPPRVGKSKPVTVGAEIVSTAESDEVVSISWSVYQWDSQLVENLVEVQKAAAAVKVPAHGRLPVSFTVRDGRFPVYLVVATMTWRDTKSIIGVRFVRDGVDRTRLNFPGLSRFPLRAGETVSLFSCLHNAGSSASVADGELQLSVSTPDGRVIHDALYKGDVTGDMMAVESSFAPGRDYDRVFVDARLYSAGQFVDEAHLDYDCRAIDPGSCSPFIDDEPTIETTSRHFDPTRPIAAGGAALVAVLIAFKLRRRFRAGWR